MYTYLTCCVDVHRSEADVLHATIEARQEISRRTFMSKVSRAEMADLFPGYLWNPYDRGRGLRMADDFCVSYYRSTWKGKRCYYVLWSGIEFIFVEAS
jgi:hypothetical protein